MSDLPSPYEDLRRGVDYAMLQGNRATRVRFERLEEWRSMNPKAIDKRRWRTHLVELRDDGSEQSFSVKFGPTSLPRWDDWTLAQHAIRSLELQEQFRSPNFSAFYWRLDRKHIAALSGAIDEVGVRHPAVKELGWPIPSRRKPFGEAHWRLGLAEMIAVGKILQTPKRQR